MIEIIPNYHPIFVHFTVGLFSTAVGFYSLSFITALLKGRQTLVQEFETVGRWCLWVAAFMTILTVAAGLQAYYTVKHDSISHLAMTNHRNWALPTAASIMLVALWSIWRYRRNVALTFTFVAVLLLIQIALLSTAWRGAELVFRYGVGVMSLPKAVEAGHDHHGMPLSSAPAATTETTSLEKQPQKNDHHSPMPHQEKSH